MPSLNGYCFDRNPQVFSSENVIVDPSWEDSLMIMWGVFRKGNCIQDFSNLCGNWSGDLFVLLVRPGYGRRAARTHDDSSGVAGSVKREHRLATYIAGALKVSNMICVMRSQFASVIRTRCSQRRVVEMAALVRTATQCARNGCSPAHRTTMSSK